MRLLERFQAREFYDDIYKNDEDFRKCKKIAIIYYPFIDKKFNDIFIINRYDIFNDKEIYIIPYRLVYMNEVYKGKYDAIMFIHSASKVPFSYVIYRILTSGMIGENDFIFIQDIRARRLPLQYYSHADNMFYPDEQTFYNVLTYFGFNVFWGLYFSNVIIKAKYTREYFGEQKIGLLFKYRVFTIYDFEELREKVKKEFNVDIYPAGSLVHRGVAQSDIDIVIFDCKGKCEEIAKYISAYQLPNVEIICWRCVRRIRMIHGKVIGTWKHKYEYSKINDFIRSLYDNNIPLSKIYSNKLNEKEKEIVMDLVLKFDYDVGEHYRDFLYRLLEMLVE